MLSSKIISLFYIKIRQSLKKLLFFIFSENSKMINFFVIFDIFLRRLGFLNYFLKGRFEYEGLIFCNDKNDTSIESSILTNQTYEPELLEEIRLTLNSGSIFIDGGANIGFFSLIASKIIGKTGAVYAFEPTPLTISYLKKNIKLNNLSNIFVINKGLSSCEKQLPFLLSSNSEANHIISRNVENLEDRKNIIKIDTISIDQFCLNNDIQKVDLIKLDIEGQEFDAIKGARETLLRNQNIKIIFELNIAYNNNGIEIAKNIFNELKKLNFSNFQALLKPRIFIKDLSNLENVELLKKITSRHNVNILATR